MNKKIATAILIVLANFWSFGQEDQLSDSLILDSQSLEVRQFEPGWEERYLGEAYDYATEVTDGENLLSRFLAVFFNWLYETFGIVVNPQLLQIIEYIIYLLLGALAVYLLLRFISKEQFNKLFKKEARGKDLVEWEDAHIEKIDFEAFILNALQAKDYRLALRYQFLRSLKFMSENQWIDWHFEKTNRDYQLEIKHPVLRENFTKASRIYEYVWYGEFPITQEHYNKYAPLMEAITLKKVA